MSGINKLKVPATDAAIPLPAVARWNRKPALPGRLRRSAISESMLFHDPVRTARININTGQPLDLPAGTAFGGTVSASDPNIQEIVNAQRQDTSCGSCHLGEAAGKAGQLLNFNSGGEGRGYTDENGNFIPRRRPHGRSSRSCAPQPLFPGDALVDALPTLDRHLLRRRPASRHDAGALLSPTRRPVAACSRPGRLDELDSVGRQSPSMIGFAFNNRLLFGGFGGEPQTTPRRGAQPASTTRRRRT